MLEVIFVVNFHYLKKYDLPSSIKNSFLKKIFADDIQHHLSKNVCVERIVNKDSKSSAKVIRVKLICHDQKVTRSDILK